MQGEDGHDWRAITIATSSEPDNEFYAIVSIWVKYKGNERRTGRSTSTVKLAPVVRDAPSAGYPILMFWASAEVAHRAERTRVEKNFMMVVNMFEVFAFADYIASGDYDHLYTSGECEWGFQADMN